MLTNSEKFKNIKEFVFDEALVNGLIHGNVRIIDKINGGWVYTKQPIKDYLKNANCNAHDDDGDLMVGGSLSRRKRKNYTKIKPTKKRKRCTTRRQRLKRSTKHYK